MGARDQARRLPADCAVRLFTRRGYDWSDRYPLIAKAVAAIPAGTATIDGEAVCCDANGVSVFDDLHSREHDSRALLYAFDLLELDGEDFRPQPLHERKARLGQLFATARAGIQYNEHVERDGQVVFAHALQARPRRHRPEAPRSPVPLGAVQDLVHIKGLEFEAVFFIGVDRLAKLEPELFDKYLYVGATRAAMYLGLTTAETSLPEKFKSLRSRFRERWG